VTSAAAAVLVVAAGAVAVPSKARPRAAVAPLGFVIASEALVAGGDYVPANMQAFTRRLESVSGLPPGRLDGRAFARPRDALEHIRRHGAAFAILPSHQFLEGRKQLRFEVIGRAVGLEGTDPGYWGITRNEPRPYTQIEHHPGLRLALTEAHDFRWLWLLFEGNVRPESHFRLVEVPTGQEALAAVLGRRADVALLYESDFRAVKPRIGKDGDLAWVYASEGVEPPPVLALAGRAPKAERRKVEQALGQICKREGADVCGRMAIMYVERCTADRYARLIDGYERAP